MSKFKVGDKVKVVNPMIMCKRYKNTIHTITDIDDTYVYLDIIDDDPYCVKYCDRELELVEEPDLYGQPVFSIGEELEKEWQKLAKHSYTGTYGINQPTLEYIDDYMDTSNRPVVDLSDHAVDSLYPNIIMDVKTCGKNLFDNCEVQTDFYEKYIKGIWENEEEKDMNKVLRVWYERKRDKVIDKYKEMEVEFYNNKYSVVESFNELVEQFNEDLESLYKMDKVTEQFVLKENTPNNVIKYCLDLDKLKEEFEVEYSTKRNEELKEIEETRIEVEAQLSLSDDLKYQQEVLERYGIISKKTKKIVG